MIVCFEANKVNDTNTYSVAVNGSDTAQTTYFINHETLQRLLYWYEQYHGMLTPKYAFIFPSVLSDGTIGIVIWRTRCNRPANHLLKYDPKTKTASLDKTNWMKKVTCLPEVEFDQSEVVR